MEAERVKVERLAELISEQKTQLDTCPEALKEQLQNQLSRVSQLPWSPSYLRPPTILLSVSHKHFLMCFFLSATALEIPFVLVGRPFFSVSFNIPKFPKNLTFCLFSV